MATWTGKPWREAFREIGYSSSAVVELKGGDEAYLRDVEPSRGPPRAGAAVERGEEYEPPKPLKRE